MSNALDVLTIGESMALLSPVDSSPLQTAATLLSTSAGAEATVANYLARLGHRVAWVSAVGDDPFGRRIVAELRAAGVGTDGVRVDPTRPTGVFFKDPDTGQTRVHYYRAGSAASTLTLGDVERMRRGAPRIIHVSGITAALSSSCASMMDAVVRHRALGPALVSFDVNYRAALWDGDEAAVVLHDLAAAADIVFVGRDEAHALWGVGDVDGIRSLLPGPRTLVIKDADVGATAFVDDDRVFMPAPFVEVIEPVGAGDAFAAGFLHGTLRGHTVHDSLTAGHRLAGLALRTRSDVADIPDEVLLELSNGTTTEESSPS